jgi:hypothetical protein
MYFGPLPRMHSDTLFCTTPWNVSGFVHQKSHACISWMWSMGWEEYYATVMHNCTWKLYGESTLLGLWSASGADDVPCLVFVTIMKRTIRLSFRALLPWICEQSMWPRIGNSLCDCPLRRTVDAVMLSPSTLVVWYRATLVEQFGNEKFLYAFNSWVTVCCQSERKVGNMLANTPGLAHSLSPSEKGSWIGLRFACMSMTRGW